MHRWLQYLTAPVGVAPLAAFRVLFGLVMVLSVVRVWANDWIRLQYLDSSFRFAYWNWDWVQPPPGQGLYWVFALLGLSALGIALGALYRLSAVVFFLCFSYIELLDKTYYLNHYYFISLAAFLLIWLPAHRGYSLDARWWPGLRNLEVPRWALATVRVQLGVVYFFAGVAKLNPDWLFEALPLRIWLAAHTDLPIVGPLLNEPWVAYGFSWFGAAYDLTIPFFLCHRKTRPWAYIAVVVFHLATSLLFQIGIFPYVMIGLSLVFMPHELHARWLSILFGTRPAEASPPPLHLPKLNLRARVTLGVLAIHFLVQSFLPFRYLFYPGPLFWREEGYRFSWRVMLMEKAGTAEFKLVNPETGQFVWAIPGQYLRPVQEKMMATQPDMILQFAHHLAQECRDAGIEQPEVYAYVWVSLQGRGSRPFIDTTVNLAAMPMQHVKPYDWILPYDYKRNTDKINSD